MPWKENEFFFKWELLEGFVQGKNIFILYFHGSHHLVYGVMGTEVEAGTPGGVWQ